MNLDRRSLLLGMGTLPLAAGLAGTARAAILEVEIRGFAYVPENLTISAGDTVRFTNFDSAPHTATATSGDAALDTGRLNRGGVGELTFDTPGTYPYFCIFHPSMTATITVT